MSFRDKADKAMADFGELLFESKGRPIDKVVGAAEVVVGAAGYLTLKAAHKAQGLIGHYINKKVGMDPVLDAMVDMEYILEEGFSRFK